WRRTPPHSLGWLFIGRMLAHVVWCRRIGWFILVWPGVAHVLSFPVRTIFVQLAGRNHKEILIPADLFPTKSCVSCPSKSYGISGHFLDVTPQGPSTERKITVLRKITSSDNAITDKYWANRASW